MTTMRSRDSILFVDDEPFFARRFVEELEKHFDVLYVSKVEDALEVLGRHEKISAIVLDVMMPSPKGNEVETASGIESGLWLVDQARTRALQWPVPILVLSNRDPSSIASRMERMQIPRHLFRVWQKMALIPTRVSHELQSLLDDKADE